MGCVPPASPPRLPRRAPYIPSNRLLLGRQTPWESVISAASVITEGRATSEPAHDSRRRPPGLEPSPARTLGLLSLALLALLAVVAVASRGHRPFGGDEAAREPSTLFWDYLFSISLAIGVVGFGVALWAILTQRGTDLSAAKQKKNRFVLLFIAALLVGLALAGRFADLTPGGRGGEQQVGTGTTSRTQIPDGGREESRGPEFQWLPIAILGSAAALTAAFFTARSRYRRSPAAETSNEALAEELAALLDDTLDDLRDEPDPRRAVIAAYARMERALARYGLPKRAFEAPLEYLDRIAGELHARLPSARRLVFELTHLFERAKFSPHTIDTGMKGEAIATLSELRDELRTEEGSA